jgi:NADH dehydrogenase
MKKEIHVVTGAFGFTGKYIAKILLDRGFEVRTLTNSSPEENPFFEKIKVFPLNFENQEALLESLKGGSVLYNTYWVRFNYRGKKINFNHSLAVENTLKLFESAKKAGIKRIVHISITNPSEDSPFEYFRGKAIIEKALINSGISYAILRPALIFGKEGILINNIAWMLRKFPFFAIFGDGSYRLQPIYVEDLAELTVEMGEREGNFIIDAIGPETFTFKELVEKIAEIIGRKRPIIPVPDSIGYLFAYIIGIFLGDVVITKEEIKALKANLLYTDSKPSGKTRFTDWARENSKLLGIEYFSEIKRRKLKKI